MKGVTVVLGSQWGDEGKGKLVDRLCQNMDVVARCQGGSNAGHTVIVGEKKFTFHMLPSGLLSQNCVSVIGNGTVVHLPSLFAELQTLEQKGVEWRGRLLLSDRAHLVFDFHQIVDGLREQELGRGSLGTTKKGIGPAYSSKATRSGMRVHHLFRFEEFARLFRQSVLNKQKRHGPFPYDVEGEILRYKNLAETFRPHVIDSVTYLNDAIDSKKRVLVEGANALMLDIDFGTYPYVTSSSACIGGAFTGLGIPPTCVQNVLGVVKAYTTRVGDGPFPTELQDDIGERLQRIGQEVGVTTGRKRRCGWLDCVVVKYASRINGFTSLCLTKLDVLDDLDTIKVAVAYKLKSGEILETFPADLYVLENAEVIFETFPGWKTSIHHVRSFKDLPENAQRYVRRIEEIVKVPIQWIGVGPERDAIVELF